MRALAQKKRQGIPPPVMRAQTASDRRKMALGLQSCGTVATRFLWQSKKDSIRKDAQFFRIASPPDISRTALMPTGRAGDRPIFQSRQLNQRNDFVVSHLKPDPCHGRGNRNGFRHDFFEEIVRRAILAGVVRL